MSTYRMTFHTKMNAFEIVKYKDDPYGRDPLTIDISNQFYDLNDLCWTFQVGDIITIFSTGFSGDTFLVFNRSTPYEEGEAVRDLPFSIDGGKSDARAYAMTSEKNPRPVYKLKNNPDSIMLTWNNTVVHIDEAYWSFDFYWGSYSGNTYIDPESKIKKAG